MNIGPQVEIFAKNVGFKDAKKGKAIIIGGAALVVVGIIAFTLIRWKKIRMPEGILRWMPRKR